jgi:hypothetical protein
MAFTVVFLDRWHVKVVRTSPYCLVDVIAPFDAATEEEKWIQGNRVEAFRPMVTYSRDTGTITEKEKEEFVPDRHRKRENHKRGLRAKANIRRMTEFANTNINIEGVSYFLPGGGLNIELCHQDMDCWKNPFRYRYSWFDEDRI